MALIIALLVVLPWMRRGWLLLLDWTPGPELSMLRSFWGLDGTPRTGLPFAVVALAASKAVGAATFGWLVIAAALAIAGIAVGHLVGGSPLRRIAAGTLYAVNPLVFDRIFAGHVGYLLAYAVLPLAVASILRWRDDVSWRGMRPALWLAVLIGLTPHFLWIGGVVVAAHVAVSRRRRSLAWACALLVLTLAMSSYFIVPSIGRPAPVRVGQTDLVSYRTRPDPTLGLALNVAGLYGFWRAEPKLAKQDVAGWPVFLAAIAVLAGTGLWKASRLEGSRHVALVVALSGAAGLLLALGDQGPTGGVFRGLFDHLPGFAIMREPQKFAALLALAYAVGFGFGVEALARRVQAGGPRLAASALAVAVPVLYTPTLFGGLAGRVDVARYPASWSAADRLMGEGDGRLLFLPWHQYLTFPFTGRVIANPAESFFQREAISGDNVELANLPTASRLQRSRYLEFLYAHGNELCAFGRLVEPLGVEYVVLAKAADFADYSWLNRQADLEIVLDRPEITLYRNRHYRGPGSRARELGRAAHWGDLAALANAGALSGGPYVVEAQRPGPITAQPCRFGPSSPRASASIRRSSPVAYRVGSGGRGYVALPEPYDPSWELAGQKPFELAGGTSGFLSDGRAGTARFGHWNLVRLADSVSAVAAALVIFGTGFGSIVEVVRGRRHHLSSPDSS